MNDEVLIDGGVDLEEAALEAKIRADNAEAVMLAWNGNASRFTDEQYRRSCLIVNGNTKDQMHLPVRDPGGSVNCDGVSAAASRVNQVSVSDEQKRSAAKKIVSLMRGQCKKEPPPALLKLAGMGSGSTSNSNSNSGNGSSGSNSNSGNNNKSGSGMRNMSDWVKGFFAPASTGTDGSSGVHLAEPIFQMPLNLSAPVELGGGKWRKALFPVGREVKYTDPATGERRVLDFSAKTLSDLVKNVKEKAFDIVPLLDRHPDPKRDGDGQNAYLGELVDADFDEKQEWVYGTFDLTEKGEERIKECPNLPTSVGYMEDYTRSGDDRYFGPTLQHVATVFKPQVHGLGPWSPVALSDGEAVREVDLRSAEFAAPTTEGKESDPVVSDENTTNGNGEVNTTETNGTPNGTPSGTPIALSEDVQRAIQLAMQERDETIQSLRSEITQLSQSNEVNTRARMERDVDYRLATEFKGVSGYLKRQVRDVLLSDVAESEFGYVALEQAEDGQPVANRKKSKVADRMWAILEHAKANPQTAVSLGEDGFGDADPDTEDPDKKIRAYAKEHNLEYDVAEERLIAMGEVKF